MTAMPFKNHQKKIQQLSRGLVEATAAN